jgi:hypothetical protein
MQPPDVPPACTARHFSEARWQNGERQQWCATCARWRFAADLAACPLGRRDETTEQQLDAFYAKENRRWITPKTPI